jgi:hypothetical protein
VGHARIARYAAAREAAMAVLQRAGGGMSGTLAAPRRGDVSIEFEVGASHHDMGYLSRR